MYRCVCVPAALLALLMLTLVVSRSHSCPRSCNCYQANEVHCTFRSLLNVPPGLPAHTRRINLGFNSISRLHDRSLAGLKKVELLMLNSNDLHHLPDGVFRDMKSLQILKLSYNKLREISSSLTFSGLTSLLRLYLDHNLLQHIHPRALLQLPSLRLLRLQGNKLHQLHPHALCTLSLLNTYYFSTLRHLDLSNNSLTILPRDSVATAPLLESLALQENPWSCDCRMNWFFTWSLTHRGVVKCPTGPQCPICATPTALQGEGLLDQTALSCSPPFIHFSGKKETSRETDLTEIPTVDSFRQPLGSVSLGLSDQQGKSVDLVCNITHSTDSQHVAPPPDLSLTSSSPLPLALSLSMECPVEGESYEKLWRILAYYSETAAHLEREIMLSKAPALAYRYRQSAEMDGYYHTAVTASVRARPHWLLQSAISIQLNRAQSNRHKVQLRYLTRVSAHPDPTSQLLTSSPSPHPWVMIATNCSTTALAAVAGSKVELSCPLLSSDNSKVQWILPDGSKLISPSRSLDGRLQASALGLLLQKVQLSDAGIYYCLAWAGRDTDVLPMRLAVEESSVPHSGELIGPPVIGAVGEAVSLSCKISGSPQPCMSWILPDGTIVRRDVAVSGGLKIQLNGSLSLPNPSVRDAGHYRCIGVNQYGSDSLSMHLKLSLQDITPHKTSIPRRPQSAAGRSTKIRAPLFHQLDEGSGDEEEQEERRTPTGNRRHSISRQPHSDRMHPVGKVQRHGPVRGGPPRRGGGPSTEQRRVRFQNRHRVTTNRQRIDPQKWADLLAKIRQKTANISNSQPMPTGNPTAGPTQRTQDKETRGHEEGDTNTGTTSSPAQGAGLEVEAEGSSVDDVVLQEEDTQPIQSGHGDTEAKTEIKKDAETENSTQRSIENQTHTKTEKSRETQTENVGPQRGTAEHPMKQREEVTSNPMSGANEIAFDLGKGHRQGANLKPTKSRPQSPQQGVSPNLIPQSRPQSPWNSRRRIGHQRRINRPRLRPVTPTQPFPYPQNTKSQTTKPDSTTNPISVRLILPTSTTPVNLLTTNDHIQTAPNNVALSTLSPHVSDTPIISNPNSASSSVTPFPTSTDTFTDLMTYSRYHKTAQTEESTLNSRPAPTLSNTVISETHDPDSYDRTFTHGLQTHTETQTAIANNAERPTSKHSEELERNVSGESHFSTPHFFSVSSAPSATSTTTTAADMTRTPSAAPERAGNAGKTKSTSTFITIQDHLSTTSTTTLISPSTSTLTAIVIPTSSSARHTSSATTSTTGTTTSTTFTFPLITSTTGTSTSTFIPIAYTSHATTEPRTSTRHSTVSFNDNPLTSNPLSSSLPTNTTTTTSNATTSDKNFPTVSTKITYSTLSSTTTTMAPTSTKASTADTSTLGQVDHGVRLVSGVPNQSGPPTDWKNPGANSIPDSHSSRSPRPPSSSLPAAPGAPVVRSRPRIADPHIRTVSFPAESTARLACEAQGVPKPSITWTKVATGAVMSIHSRVQRFEVLPNGTLVIQNVQLQDRGTYICSANSFLGRDRLLTSLEVWTRPPRMQLATYREVIIHQGGEVHLECQADGVPTPLLSWVLPDRSTLTSTGSSSTRIRMDINGTLHISVALPADRGLYRCMASNSAGAASTSVRVHVSSLPPVIHQPREEHLLLSPGRPLYIHCSARGAPPPILRWQIPGGTVVRPSQFLHGNLFVLPNGTLHIRKVGPKDTGSYECTATNAVGINVRTVKVVVEGGAEIERREGETINEGPKEVSSEETTPPNKERMLSVPFNPSDPSTSANFSPLYPPDTSRSILLKQTPFNSSSNFAPKIYETETALPTDFTNIKRTNLPSPSSSSTLSTNNTKVSPGMNNTRETSSFPADRKTSAVLKPLPISPFTKARIISTSPSTSTVHYGGTLQLHCSVTGNPMPIIIWRNPNKKLVDMHYSFDRRMKVHPNGTLSVQAVTEKDAGEYLCIARNKVADDYRLLRVSVATKPAKIEPKQPLNHMVSFGKPLKVDCQVSGLPDPVVRWSLPDGTMVNSVLHGEERVVRAQRPTVFDNGTLLVPVAGMREEGEYMCYAENQGGQDTMKVKVKVMMTSPPRFTHDRSHSVVKVHQGATATIPCQATGDPVPTVTWFSPARRVIPQSLGSGLYSERVVVSSGGILQIRSAKRIDTGNYTCQATNSAGETSMVVSLEVEASTHGLGGQVEGRRWSTNEHSRGQGITLGDKTDNAGIIGSGIARKLDNNNSSSNSYADTNGRTTSLHPTLRSNNQNGFIRHFGESSPGIGTGVSRQQSIGSEAGSTGINRNGPSLMSSSISLGMSHTTDRVDSAAGNSGTNNNEVIAGRTGNDANSSRDNNRLSFNSRLFSNGAGTSIFRGNSLSKNSNLGGTSDSRGKSGGSSGNFNTDVGVVTAMKQQAVEGQTILLPCPSQGSPPHRLAWLLPGNGMLPAPYYGSRLTVHRNGSLELRGVRGSDGGTLACVVRSERGETLIRVQLEVSEPQEESRSLQRGLGQERPHTGSLPSTAQSFRSESPFLQLQRGLSSPATPRPVKSPPPAGPGSEPIVSMRTAPLVSIINGETLHLSCTTSQTQGSLSWTMPSGKVLSTGESGDSGRYVVRQDGTLIVEQASVFDRGTYTCRSSSNNSSSVSVVTVPVIVIAYPPRITKGPSPMTYTHSGVAVELPCLTIATPRATVTWESPDLTQLTVMGQPRIYGNRYLSPQGSLVIQNPTHRDMGFYRCTAKNVIGVDSKATYLHVI